MAEVRVVHPRRQGLKETNLGYSANNGGDEVASSWPAGASEDVCILHTSPGTTMLTAWREAENVGFVTNKPPNPPPRERYSVRYLVYRSRAGIG